MSLWHNRTLLPKEVRKLLLKGRDGEINSLYGTDVLIEDYVSEGGHFRIHYTRDNVHGDAVPLTDDDGDGVPDYVEKMARFLEYAWDIETEVLGYNAPPSDGNEGGDCLFDVYLADIAETFGYGVTRVDEGSPPSSVYIELENDFLPFCNDTGKTSSTVCFPPNLNPGGLQEGAMKVAAAHELFHAIQFQISDNVDKYEWWMEASATWMEDFVYPEVKDYVNYISYWFAHPERPVNTSFDIYGFEYGTVVWLKHLTEKYGSSFIYNVWSKIDNTSRAIDLIESELLSHGETLVDELERLRVANVTFTYNDGLIYKNWIEPISVPLNDITLDASENGTLSPLSARYYVINNAQGNIRIDFRGGEKVNAVVVGMTSSDSIYDVSEIDLDPSTYEGSLIVEGASYDKIVIIVINSSKDTEGSFTLLVSSTGPSDSVAHMDILPAGASIIYGERSGSTDIRGRRQFFIRMINNLGEQILTRGITWGTDLPDSSVVVTPGGFLLVNSLNYADQGNIIAIFDNITATGEITITSPEIKAPGSPRICEPSSHGGSDTRCFIATATFGSPFHPYVRILRKFRDMYLLTNPAGRYVVNLYYAYSPYVAEYIRHHPGLKIVVRALLIPLIGMGWILVNWGGNGGYIIFLSLIMLFLGTCFYKFYNRRV